MPRDKKKHYLILEKFYTRQLYITIEYYEHETIFVIKAHNKITFWKGQRNLSMEIFQ